jgi:hypothetical protein
MKRRHVATIVALCGCLAAPFPARGSDRPRPAVEGQEWLAGFRAAADAIEWSDQRVEHDWRLQRRAKSDDWRLLDPRDRVVASGSGEECRAALEKRRQDGEVPEVGREAVLVLHGLGEGRHSMQPLVDHLRDAVEGTVMTVGYASPRAGIDDHARSLAAVVGSPPKESLVSFVGHSLGGIVIRRWMAMADREAVARVGRVVMLGSPNRGSDLAKMASRIWIVSLVADGAARELVVDWDRIEGSLAVPACPFGIVAGGRGDDRGYSDLLEGDDDAVVRVEETRLEGADDFLLLPVRHAAMMKSETVQRATAEFLRSGRFTPAERP